MGWRLCECEPEVVFSPPLRLLGGLRVYRLFPRAPASTPPPVPLIIACARHTRPANALAVQGKEYLRNYQKPNVRTYTRAKGERFVDSETLCRPPSAKLRVYSPLLLLLWLR